MAYNNSMGKRTLRNTPAAPRNSSRPRISRRDCRAIIKARLANGRQRPPHTRPDARRLQAVVQGQALECPICLQTLLWPVLAECGHLFCLPCAEDLGRHDFGCGMCRQFEPCFEPRVDARFRQLVAGHMERCSSEERLVFKQRQKALQAKERDRKAGELSVGDGVDLWSIEGKSWVSASVRDITEEGQLVLVEEGRLVVSDPKAAKLVTLDADSRRIARHRCFTKEEVVVAVEGVEVNGFGERRSIYGMPMFINFFGDAPGPFNVDINDFLGILPFRPFPF